MLFRSTNVNCLDRFFWIRDGLCDVPVKGQSFNQIWICLGLFGPKGFKLPQSKSMSQIELSWGNGKSGFWIMKKVTLCNHGQGSEKDFWVW